MVVVSGVMPIRRLPPRRSPEFDSDDESVFWSESEVVSDVPS
jgi:hypothetical protein